MYGVEAYANISLIETSLSLVGTLTAASSPAIIAAAVLLWYRKQYLLPQTGGQS